jgi:hypothetical protein
MIFYYNHISTFHHLILKKAEKVTATAVNISIQHNLLPKGLYDERSVKVM